MREVFVFERFYRCTLSENLISPFKISYFFQILFCFYRSGCDCYVCYVVKVSSVTKHHTRVLYLDLLNTEDKSRQKDQEFGYEGT